MVFWNKYIPTWIRRWNSWTQRLLTLLKTEDRNAINRFYSRLQRPNPNPMVCLIMKPTISLWWKAIDELVKNCLHHMKIWYWLLAYTYMYVFSSLNNLFTSYIFSVGPIYTSTEIKKFTVNLNWGIHFQCIIVHVSISVCEVHVIFQAQCCQSIQMRHLGDVRDSEVSHLINNVQHTNVRVGLRNEFYDIFSVLSKQILVLNP